MHYTCVLGSLGHALNLRAWALPNMSHENKRRQVCSEFVPSPHKYNQQQQLAHQKANLLLVSVSPAPAPSVSHLGLLLGHFGLFWAGSVWKPTNRLLQCPNGSKRPGLIRESAFGLLYSAVLLFLLLLLSFFFLFFAGILLSSIPVTFNAWTSSIG